LIIIKLKRPKLKVCNLIEKLQEMPQDYEVRFEDECDGKYFGDMIEDVRLYPNQQCGSIRLIGSAQVREEYRNELKDFIEHGDITAVKRVVVALVRKAGNWMGG
jgi:hypothetical protein